MRAGAGELERKARQTAYELIVSWQVERAFSDCIDHYARGEQAVAGRAIGTKPVEIRQRKLLTNPIHARDEVIHHAICLGITRIETHQLAICNQVNTGQFLGLQNHH